MGCIAMPLAALPADTLTPFVVAFLDLRDPAVYRFGNCGGFCSRNWRADERKGGTDIANPKNADATIPIKNFLPGDALSGGNWKSRSDRVAGSCRPLTEDRDMPTIARTLCS